MSNVNKFSTKIPITKLGNWQEEKVLQQELQQEYADKKSKGLLASSLLDKCQHLCSKSVVLGSQLAVNVPLELVSVACRGKLAVNFSLNWPHADSPRVARATRLPGTRSGSRNVTDTSIEFPVAVTAPSDGSEAPVARTSFSLQRTAEYDAVLGDTPQLCYGDKFYIEASPLLELAPHHQFGSSVNGNVPFYLASIKSFTDSTPGSNLQKVFLTPKKDFNAVWQVQLADPEYRLEALGKPLSKSQPVLLIHCATNGALYSNPAYVERNLFAVESEVSCGTVCDQNTKIELPFNHWYITN